MDLQVNQRELATLVGRDPTTISRFQRQGMPYLPRETNGKAAKYYAPAAINWMLGHRWCAQREANADNLQKVAIGYFLNCNKRAGESEVSGFASLLDAGGLNGSAEQLIGFASGITAAQG
ncbi:MAG: hypothetical protein AAF756_10845 [Pseudomonadota bacterium]